MLHDAFSVAVPATSANLGPGFDAVGVALSLHLRAFVEPASRFSIAFRGKHVPTHDGYERIFREALSHLPAVAITVCNDIPLGKGLGSSAAARVAARAIMTMYEGRRLDRAVLARESAALEGHPDNAYAAVYGGVVISAQATAIALPPPNGVRAIVIVPDIEFGTREARGILPKAYSAADCAFTAARASLLGAALASSSLGALREAMRDRMHQPYRAKAVPGLDAIVALRMPGLYGVALSGAGPSVLAFASAKSAERVTHSIHTRFAEAGIASRAFDLSCIRRGLHVRRELRRAS